MNKRLWILLAVLVVLVLGGLILWKFSQGETAKYLKYLDKDKMATVQDVIDAKNKVANGGELSSDFQLSDDEKKAIIPDHYVGKKDSKVVVIEYEDFACVHCAQMNATFDKIMEDYSDRVLFIYRNFSLSYPNSTITQSAAEAAYLLGGEEAFWKMHDLLFQDDSTWTGQALSIDDRKAKISAFAEEIGLDAEKLLNSITSSAIKENGIKDKLNRDKELDVLNVKGTPTWFVNGEKVEVTDESIRKALDAALGE